MMKVILLDKINNLGSLGAQVTVKSGYARNFLIPRAKAIVATKKNIDDFKAQQSKLQVESREKWNTAKNCAETINALKCVVIKANAGVEGKLFGSVGSRDIADAIIKIVGFSVTKAQVRLPNNDVLKAVGTYNVKIHIYNEIFSVLDIVIVNALSPKYNDVSVHV